MKKIHFNWILTYTGLWGMRQKSGEPPKVAEQFSKAPFEVKSMIYADAIKKSPASNGIKLTGDKGKYIYVFSGWYYYHSTVSLEGVVNKLIDDVNKLC